jgi:hypothetical protein
MIYTKDLESETGKKNGHLHESFKVREPEAGVVNMLFGSDSQVTVPLYFRMYLY